MPVLGGGKGVISGVKFGRSRSHAFLVHPILDTSAVFYVVLRWLYPALQYLSPLYKSKSRSINIYQQKKYAAQETSSGTEQAKYRLRQNQRVTFSSRLDLACKAVTDPSALIPSLFDIKHPRPGWIFTLWSPFPWGWWGRASGLPLGTSPF